MEPRNLDPDLVLASDNKENCVGVTENAIVPGNGSAKSYKPRTLIDRTLELVDPTPNIHTLFMQFNKQFFSNVLLPVEVRWSNRMKSCAGTCSFHPKNRHCVISLSAPLLKLRPRKDLVETLLHEMIHGYLFLTNNNCDRDGHGPEFCKHMNRINKEAGTSITIYHSFYDEVNLYKQHWWKCNGPCQNRAPYFGLIRRVMNRPPGPSDFWWKDHQRGCTGQFIKIKEPKNFKAKNTKSNDKEKSAAPPSGSTVPSDSKLINWLTNTSISTKHVPAPKSIKPRYNPVATISGIKKLGNSANNVYGWSTAGPSEFRNYTTNRTSNNTPHRKTPTVSGGRVLGGRRTGRSNLLSKFDTGLRNDDNAKSPKEGSTTDVCSGTSSSGHTEVLGASKSPISARSVSNKDVANRYANKYLPKENEFGDRSSTGAASSPTGGTTLNHSTPKLKRKDDSRTFAIKKPTLDPPHSSKKQARCPVCEKSLPVGYIDKHLDRCLLDTVDCYCTNDDGQTVDPSVVIIDSGCDTSNNKKDESVISINSSTDSDTSLPRIEEVSGSSTGSSTLSSTNDIKQNGYRCLVCNALIGPELTLKDHLEDCIDSIFTDDLTLSDCESNDEPSLPADNKVPCPICPKLISESHMNEHLNLCLQTFVDSTSPFDTD